MEKIKQRSNSSLWSWMFFRLADETHLRVSRELAWSDLTAQGNYFENGVRTGEISENRKKAIIVLIFKKMKRGVDQSISFQLPRKKNSGSSIQTSGWEQGDMNQPTLICQEQIMSSNQVFSYDMVTGLCIEKEKYLYFRKVSDSVFYDIFLCNPGSFWNCHMVGIQLIGILCVKTNCSAARM